MEEEKEMTKEYINPPTLFQSVQYGFSQIVTSTGGKTVYLSGQVAWDAEQNVVGADDLRAQVWQSLRNVETAVQSAGGALTDVVSMRIYIVQQAMADTSAVSEGLQAFFPAAKLPATTWLGVPSLANDDFLIEFEAIAVIE